MSWALRDEEMGGANIPSRGAKKVRREGGGTTEGQIGARLKRALKATFKGYVFSCVIFVPRIKMLGIVLSEQNLGDHQEGAKLSWKTSGHPEKVTLATRWHRWLV